MEDLIVWATSIIHSCHEKNRFNKEVKLKIKAESSNLHFFRSGFESFKTYFQELVQYITYMWSLKKKQTNEYNKKESESHIQRIN